MRNAFVLFAGFFALMNSTQVLAAECSAARSMVDDKELDARLERTQRAEWLLGEFLATDTSKASKDLLAERSGRQKERDQEFDRLVAEFEKLPAGQPDFPVEGTPGCEIAAREAKFLYKQLDDREAELKHHFANGYLFILGCDLVSTNLVKLSGSASTPESKADPQALVKVAEFSLEYPMKAAKLKPADFEKLAGEIFQPSQLSAKTLYSYAALRCLRVNQGVEIKPLAASSEALNMCATLNWEKLGKCVVEVTQPVKH